MNIKRGSIVTLEDGRKYLVLSRVQYDEKNFLYMIDMNNNKNIKFGCEKHEQNVLKISPVIDENLIKNLLPLFDENLAEMI